MSYQRLGQLTQVTSVISQGITQGAALASQKAVLTQEKRLEQIRAESAQAIADKELTFRQQQLVSEQQIAANRDALFTKLFGISAIGIILLGLVIAGGVVIVQGKGN